MLSSTNLSDLPEDVLLNVFGKIDREEGKTDSVRLNLSLVCRRFNVIITNPSNQKQLESIRTRVNKITIAQIGNYRVIRVGAYPNKLIYPVPELPAGNQSREEGAAINDNWVKPNHCHTPSVDEFFDKLAGTVDNFETEIIQLSNMFLTRSFISSLILALGKRSRIATLDFNIERCGLPDYSERIGLTEFSCDVDDVLMGNLARNFKCVKSIPNRFVTTEFIEKWTEEQEFNIHLTSPLRSHRNFPFGEICNYLAELASAIEARLQYACTIEWTITLSDNAAEIQTFVRTHGKNYNRVVNFPETRVLGLQKYFHFKGTLNAVCMFIHPVHGAPDIVAQVYIRDNMNRISVLPFFMDVDPQLGSTIHVFDVTDRTHISGYPVRPFAAQLVLGHGVMDHAELKRIVRRAVYEFGDRRPRMLGEEKLKKIEELRKKNDEGITCTFTRQCTICCSPYPDTRAVLTKCGHILCMACVLQMEINGRLDCPICTKNGEFVLLQEEKVDEEKKEVTQERSTLWLRFRNLLASALHLLPSSLRSILRIQ
ncbi:hypothetical protein PRIPAC_75252 [Pristionchus pacificus]|uniref:F-box domain-containing protein n=1 Tax=Pristionchus pacificus TaxID=54126 RepID=A0A2A6C988_PRIPA|nr:hypothetical protein PRIPAC_75252 [Pristionchus pacificus]|eukprot:PDM74677.1 F-box domain-containing protein [Pristionchus pacificus]